MNARVTWLELFVRLGPIAALALACAPKIPEGWYACTPGDPGSCPPGWACRSNGFCYKTPDEDATQPEAGPEDAYDAIDTADDWAGPETVGDDAHDIVDTPDDARTECSAEESCNGRDDDCDGLTDEGFECVPGATRDCTTSCQSIGWQTCSESCTWGDCVAPNEVCNGVDDDCDEKTDEQLWCSVRPAGWGSDLYGIHGQAADDFWVVGSRFIAHWNGNQWVRMTEASQGNWELRAVWTVPGNRAWAVGTNTVIVSWDGNERRWTRVRVDGTDTGAVDLDAEAVWASSADEVWVVGRAREDDEPTVLRRRVLDDGSTRWIGYRFPRVRSFGAVWGTASDNVYVAGQGGSVWHWNGTDWSRLDPCYLERDLYAMHGSGDDNFWVAGAHGSACRWDSGYRRLVDSSTQVNAAMDGLWVASPALAWVVGHGGHILRWDGTGWTPSDSREAQGRSLYAVWGASSDEVWAVGLGGTILRWRE